MSPIICIATLPDKSPKPVCVYRITEGAGRFNIALISGEEPEGFVADHATLEDAKNQIDGRHPDSKGWQLTFRPE